MVTKNVRPVRSTVAAALLLTSWWSGSPGASPLPMPRETIVNVATEAELQTAVASIASDATIVIAPGIYALSSTLSISGSFTNVAIRGATNNPNDVVLVGRGMSNADYGAVPNGISVDGVQGLTIANLTIRDVFCDAIVLNAGTVAPRISHVHLVNPGQRFVKANDDDKGGGVDDGVIEYSEMEYNATGRVSFTSGVEVNGGSGWIVRGNTFRGIREPSGQLAGPAVLIWRGSRNSVVEGNTFTNWQREVAFGPEERTPNDSEANIVRNNSISRAASVNGTSAIHVAGSPNTQVPHNTIPVNGTSPSRIDNRVGETVGGAIQGKLPDGQIGARDGANGAAFGNYTAAVPSTFVNAAGGKLPRIAGATVVRDGVTAGSMRRWTSTGFYVLKVPLQTSARTDTT